MNAQTAAPTAKRSPWRRVRYWAVRVGIVYLGVLLVLMLLENRMVYRPSTAAADWAVPPTPEIEDVWLKAADGTKLHAWYCPQPGSDKAVLYLHGNAGNLSHRGKSIVNVRDALKASVLIVDYPGYGKSEGAPSEKGCYQSADAAYAWLTQEKTIAPGKLLLFGASLGGAVAVDLASRKEHRALILVKTFTSAPDVGATFYPWLPVRWVMRNRFDSAAKIKNVRTPVFIAHGSQDRIVPFALGKRLYEAANEPKTFVELEGQDHNDGLGHDFYSGLLGFLGNGD